MTIERQPKGVPAGGQFAASARAEPKLTLDPPLTHYRDADGTEWETPWVDDDHSETISSMIGGIDLRITTDVRAEDVAYEAVDFRRGYNSSARMVGRGRAATMDEAKTAAKALRENANRWGFNELAEGSRTPWGKADGVENLAPGIDVAFTSGHGGYKLSVERNKEVHPVWRQRSGWYEEDSAFSIAVLSHHQDMSDRMVRFAHETARRWHPNEYEQVVGADPAKYGVEDYKPVQPGESHVRDEQNFWAEKAATHFKVSSGRDSETHPGMTEATVRTVPEGSVDGAPGTERVYLVPKEQYADYVLKNRYSFPKENEYQLLYGGGTR